MRFIIKTDNIYNKERKNRSRNRSGLRYTVCGLVINPNDKAYVIHGHKPCKNCFKKENK